MNLHDDLQLRVFDRIVFNFPHAGFNGREDNVDMINYVHDELSCGNLFCTSVYTPLDRWIWLAGRIRSW